MFRSKVFALAMAAALTGTLAIGGTATADHGSVTLIDDNSEATIDFESSDGMDSWVVDGVDHLYQQWFWYRIGNQGGEASIDTLDLGVHGLTDTNFDGDDDTFFVEYLDPGDRFSIEVRFGLDGGADGSGGADITEQITITNLTGDALDFHFFQYSDFDLNGSSSDDTVRLTNANTWRQTDGGTSLSETIVTPAGTHFEAAFWSDLLDRLEDSSPTTLADFAGPLGPDDVTWAFQWDTVIPAYGSMQISKDKNIRVPAPGAALLGMMGLGMVRWARRRIA